MKFTPSTGEFTIEPNWTVSGVATFKPDVGEWTQALEDEFSAVLAGLLKRLIRLTSRCGVLILYEWSNSGSLTR